MEIKRIDWSLIGDFKGDTVKEAVETAVKEGISLEKANVPAADLEGINLQGANLRGADLGWIDFRYANLSNINFEGANLNNANLQDANLKGANLQKANLCSADFRRANLQGVKGISKWRTPELEELLDRPDPITAYKLVDTEGYGPYAGGIKYVISKKVKVENANTDVRIECGAGINVASLSWVMEKWKLWYRILVVEFNVIDIAVLPIGTDGKFRLHKCKVVREINIEKLKNMKEK